MLRTVTPKNHSAHQLEAEIAEAEAIRQCLIYLEVEANKMGRSVTAHLIAVAAESIRDQITQSKGNEIIANGTKH